MYYVLCDLNQSWIHSYNQEYHDSIQPEDVTTWSAMGSLKKECQSIQKYFIDKKRYLRLLPKNGAIRVVNTLIDKGYDIYIVTDSPMSEFNEDGYFESNPADEKRMWLKTHFPRIPLNHLIITSEKWMVQGDILIDDKPATVEKFQALGRKVICFDMPYNRDIKANSRVHNWGEVEKEIEKLLNQESESELVAVI